MARIGPLGNRSRDGAARARAPQAIAAFVLAGVGCATGLATSPIVPSAVPSRRSAPPATSVPRPESGASATAAIVATGSASAAPNAVTLDERCELLQQQQREQFDVARGLTTETGDALDDRVFAGLPRQLGQCQRSGLGAWVISLTDLGPSGRHSFTGSLEVVYVGPDGSPKVQPEPPMLGELGGCEELTFHRLDPFGFDRDGHPELVFCHQQRGYAFLLGNGTASQIDLSSCTIYAAPPRYGNYLSAPLHPPAQGHWRLEDVRDVDGDHRPDLLTRSPFDEVAQLGDGGCGLRGGCRRDTRGPLLVAHSLPDGTFTFDDPVARAAARRVCPSPPPFAFGKAPGAQAFAQGVERLVCMLIWQAPALEVERELQRVRQVFCNDPQCDELADLRRKIEDEDLLLPRLP